MATANKYAQELARRRARASWDPRALLFDRQQAVWDNPSRYRVLCCGRRGGKTAIAAVALIATAVAHERTDSIYIAPSQDQAWALIWRDLVDYIERFCLEATATESDLVISFKNGSTIQLRGVDDIDTTKFFRGRKFKLVWVDECQDVSNLRPLIEASIGPTLGDKDGRCVLSGTPGQVEAGFWWECVSGARGWPSWHWTLLENPHMPNPAAFLAEQARNLGGEDNATFVREYLGRWVRDLLSLVFRFDPSRNVYAQPPAGTMETCFGVDLGTNPDASAIAVLGWLPKDPRLYLLEEWVANDVTVDDLADQVLSMSTRWDPMFTVVDEGGLGKLIAETMRKRRGVSCRAANKQGKFAQIEAMNADLMKGHLLVRGDSRAANDFGLVRWDPKARERGKLEVAKKPHSDILDAVRYASTECRHYTEVPDPVLTEDEARRATIAAELREAAERAARPWYEQYQPPRY